ncbi:MAG: hypothetical protein A3F40_00705 [Chlamydiae bacterium RIFCSPHIGHO2_12_FULL_27_8]|nr:MAG: hypothetical protein A3F40_00705 [Chlamydiae bacterium RIFCSPHIGHO2_12_FULL_27_8]
MPLFGDLLSCNYNFSFCGIEKMFCCIKPDDTVKIEERVQKSIDEHIKSEINVFKRRCISELYSVEADDQNEKLRYIQEVCDIDFDQKIKDLSPFTKNQHRKFLNQVSYIRKYGSFAVKLWADFQKIDCHSIEDLTKYKQRKAISVNVFSFYVTLLSSRTLNKESFNELSDENKKKFLKTSKKIIDSTSGCFSNSFEAINFGDTYISWLRRNEIIKPLNESPLDLIAMEISTAQQLEPVLAVYDSAAGVFSRAPLPQLMRQNSMKEEYYLNLLTHGDTNLKEKADKILRVLCLLLKMDYNNLIQNAVSEEEQKLLSAEITYFNNSISITKHFYEAIKALNFSKKESSVLSKEDNKILKDHFISRTILNEFISFVSDVSIYDHIDRSKSIFDLNNEEFAILYRCIKSDDRVKIAEKINLGDL